MRKHSNIRSALSLLLTFIMVFSQSGVTTLAVSEEGETSWADTETELSLGTLRGHLLKKPEQ